uniref:Anoctamin n=1 Tax=Lepeophtheirus salmonis TaxID=72036 RepID=A0A0K2T7S2_LEPSM
MLQLTSKLIRQNELPSLLTLKKIWKNTSPIEPCDVVITFHPNTPEHVVLWCKLQLEKIKGIIIETKRLTVRYNGCKEECQCFQIASTFEGYLKGLVLMHVPKPVREDFGGGLKEFNVKEAHEFVGIESIESFLTSQERQSIVMFLISSLRTENEETIHDVHFRKGEAIFPRGLRSNLIHKLYPLHELDSLQYLKHNWVKVVASSQPIEKISEYFGIQIGFYFAWLGHYTFALIIPAIVGILFWLILCGRGDFYEDIGFISFAIFNVVWSSLYLTFWKQKSSYLSQKWSVSTDKVSENSKEARPLFEGEERINDITKEIVLYYPSWKRNITIYFLTIPVISICLLFVGLALFLVLELQQWFDATFSDEGTQGFLLYIPKILLAIIIPIMDTIYYKIAYWLNDQENYKLQEDYDNNLILKLILFQFVNSFLSLFYSAFYLQDMDKLSELLSTLLITRQIVGNIRESFVPFVKKQMEIMYLFLGENPSKSSLEKKESSQPVALSQIEVECNAPEYEGTFDDYLEMVIQFGYVTLFSASYPLAGFFALLNNIIEVRSDAFKLCFVCKRPFGQRVKGIGSWSTVMDMMGAMGVVVNCALLTLPGRVKTIAPGFTSLAVIFGALILEHLLFIMKYIISYAIPEVSMDVLTQKFKIDFQRKQMQLKRAFSEEMTQEKVNTTVEVGTQTYIRPMLPPKEMKDPISDSHTTQESVKPIPNILISEDVDIEAKKRRKKTLSKHNTIGEIQFHSSSPIINQMGGTQSQKPGVIVRSKSPDPSKKPHHHHHHHHHHSIKQRMSSETDLWLSANNERLSTLTSLQEAPNENESSKIIVNQIRMPSVDEENFPTPAPHEEKKTFNQEEVIKKLKAKQALFSKGRSISIASFKFPTSASKPKKFNLNNVVSSGANSSQSLVSQPISAPIIESNKDNKYLAKNPIRGELDLLNLDKLINVQDLRKKSA